MIFSISLFRLARATNSGLSMIFNKVHFDMKHISTARCCEIMVQSMLFDMFKPRLSLSSDGCSTLLPFLFLRKNLPPPTPVNQKPAAESSTPPKSQFCQANMINKADISPFCQANIMAEYTRRLFQHLVKVDSAEPYRMPHFPFQLPYSAMEDAHHIAALAAKAYQNPSRSYVGMMYTN